MNFNYFYLARRNPSIPEEDWTRVWRSHFEFAQQFPVVWAAFKDLQYFARIRKPTVPAPGLSTEYDGAALITGRSAEVRPRLTPEIRAAIDKDELRVFSTNVKHFSFRCQVASTWGGEGPYPAVVLRFLARKSGTSRDDFVARWMGPHAGVVTRAAETSGKVKRYVQNRIIDDPMPPGYPFDGVSETWFASADEAAQSLSGSALAPVAADLQTFCDMDRSVTLLTEVIQRWKSSE